MIGIVVTGHGDFSKGIGSALRLIAGEQEAYEEVIFENECTPEVLSSRIASAIKNVNTGDGVIVFTDLKGGTPFKESVMIAMQHDDVHVLTGTNIAMLLEASLARLSKPEIRNFAFLLAETGRSQVELFDRETLNIKADEIDEDGI